MSYCNYFELTNENSRVEWLIMYIFIVISLLSYTAPMADKLPYTIGFTAENVGSNSL